MSDLDTELQLLEKELEVVNPIELLTPNEVLDNIQIYDSTVEIIGYIDGIESPRIVGNKQQYKVLKFYLNNGKGRRIQVIAWSDDINYIINHIVPNHIIHLDGVQARIPKIVSFNNGNVQYELLVRKNTIIANLGKYDPTPSLIEKPVSIKLSEILHSTQRIIVEAYIKTNFSEVHDSKLNKLIGYGSITDGTYKVEVHIINFTNEEYKNIEIRKGDKIEIIGFIQKTSDPIYLLVNNLKDIRRIKGHMEFAMLLKGVQILKKRKIEENSQEIERKRNSI